jgi:hypothetical protein
MRRSEMLWRNYLEISTPPTAPITRCRQRLARPRWHTERETYLDVTVDGELASGQSTNHEQTSANTSIAATDTELFANLEQSAGGALAGETLGLVDLGQHGVGGLRDNGGSETSNETRSQVDHGLGTIRGGVLVQVLPDSLGNLFVDDEFGHCVRDLLEQDGTKSTVEGANTLSSHDLAKAAHQTRSECGLRNQSDTSGLERAEGNVGEELGEGRGSKVDGGSVVRCGLVAEEIDGLLLEEFVTSKLEGTLQEVTCKGRADTGEQSTSSFIGNDLSETADQATVVCDGIELDSCLDAARVSAQLERVAGGNLHIDGSEGAVSDRAADCTSEGLHLSVHFVLG